MKGGDVMREPLIIAHRGASAYGPENTMDSFRKAITMGADGIEVDVHLSMDGELIVCHDEKVDRTTNGKGFIKDLTLEEIKKLDAGSWFSYEYSREEVPTLEEVIILIKESGLMLNIELKSGPIFYTGIEKKVIDLICKYGLEEKVIISSFNHYSLIEIKRINEKIKTGVLYMAGLVEPWTYAQKINADAIHPFFYSVIPEVIIGCMKNNILINPFTVDDEPYLTAMVIAGVSGIITNYPDRARKIIDGIKKGSDL